MLGEYAALAKWSLIIGTMSAVFYFIEDFGYNRAWDKHKSLELIRLKEVSKIVNEEHDKATQETAKSSAYAEFIGTEYNDKVNQLKQAQSDNLDLNSAVSRVQQRTACGRGENRVSQGDHTGVHVDTSADDGSGFSDEFKQFLKSQARRDEFNAIWIEEAVKAANQLCKQSNVVCNK
jgi:hypothetical protein